jgi:hypothetical protein
LLFASLVSLSLDSNLYSVFISQLAYNGFVYEK